MNVKRVILLSTQRPSDNTGVRVYCDSLEKALEVAGVEVVRLTHLDAPDGLRKLTGFILKISRIFGRNFQSVISRLVVYVQAKSVLRHISGSVDAVLAQDPITGAAANSLGYKTSVTCHFSDPIGEILNGYSYGPITAFLMERLMKWMLRRNPLYVALSPTLAENVRRHCPTARVVVIPTICRIAAVPKRESHEGFRVAMMGRIEYLKGQDRLVEALAFLRDVPVEVWLIGAGAYQTELEKLAGKLGVEKRLRFCGQCVHPENVLSQCDLYIHVSRMEAMSLAPIEAIRSGCLAWCYETPGYNDYGLFDQVPRFAQETPANELADTIREFFSVSAEMRRCQWESQLEAAKCFSPDAVVKRYFDILYTRDVYDEVV